MKAKERMHRREQNESTKYLGGIYYYRGFKQAEGIESCGRVE